MGRHRQEKDTTAFERLKNKISWFFYGLTQPVFASLRRKNKGKTSIGGARRSELIFYSLIVAIPLIQVAIFYIYVNLNSFVMAFRKYDADTSEYIWVGFTNLKDVLTEIFTGGVLQSAAINSVLVYGLNLCLLPLQVFLPYYIYKKLPGAEFFKVMLFLPSVLSTMVLGLLYISVMDIVVPELAFKWFDKDLPALLSGQAGYGRIISAWTFSAIFGFANVLMYTSAMGRIPQSIVEYAKLDGVSPLQEFFKITLPLILPTIMVYITTGIAGIFTDQVNLFTFFNSGSTVQTVGYYIFTKTLTSTGYQAYPIVAATGLIFSCVATPLMLIVRKLVMRYDPEAEF
ncbi:MAG: sugar ABC transporter permease [Clostridia bacterium]|nr:sugar ABC transporter permease [Clostridia bacterium]